MTAFPYTIFVFINVTLSTEVPVIKILARLY